MADNLVYWSMRVAQTCSECGGGCRCRMEDWFGTSVIASFDCCVHSDGPHVRGSSCAEDCEGCEECEPEDWDDDFDDHEEGE